MSLENPSVFNNNPELIPQQEKDESDQRKDVKMTFRKKSNPFVTGAVGLGILIGGAVNGLRAESPKANGEKKGKAETTQVSKIKTSIERMEPQTIAFSQPVVEKEKTSDDIDAMLSAESSKSNYSLKQKGPSTEDVLGYQDAQKEGAIYQTGTGKKEQVDKEYNKLKKEHKQEKKTVVSFADEK